MLALKSLYDTFLSILNNRKLIFELSKNDFKSKYLGSYLGIVWAFIQPTIMILIFWFVFQVGFRSSPVDNFPFILWLISGMIPWFFISDSITNATGSIVENSYLVKKVVFKVSLLPVVKIISTLYIHLFFLVVLFGMFIVYGYTPTIYSIQIFYYLFASIALMLGISYITSSLVVFLRDIGQIVTMFIQFGLWLTPVFWSLKIVPEKYHFLLKLNPFYYIIDGYRNTFVYHRWFWEYPNLSIYYWTVVAIIMLSGALFYKKLRPHFSDVL